MDATVGVLEADDTIDVGDAAGVLDAVAGVLVATDEPPAPVFPPQPATPVTTVSMIAEHVSARTQRPFPVPSTTSPPCSRPGPAILLAADEPFGVIHSKEFVKR